MSVFEPVIQAAESFQPRACRGVVHAVRGSHLRIREFNQRLVATFGAFWPPPRRLLE